MQPGVSGSQGGATWRSPVTLSGAGVAAVATEGARHANDVMATAAMASRFIARRVLPPLVRRLKRRDEGLRGESAMRAPEPAQPGPLAERPACARGPGALPSPG